MPLIAKVWSTVETPETNKTLKSLPGAGEQWVITYCSLHCLEASTCLMYGYRQITSLNEVRTQILKKMVGQNEKLPHNSKVDLSCLRPYRDVLKPHIQHVNYCVELCKRAVIPIFEMPTAYEDQGWKVVRDHIEP